MSLGGFQCDIGTAVRGVGLHWHCGGAKCDIGGTSEPRATLHAQTRKRVVDARVSIVAYEPTHPNVFTVARPWHT